MGAYAALIPTVAGALPLAPPSPAAVRYQPNRAGQPVSTQHREHLTASGVYRVRVEVTARRRSSRLVQLRIGQVRRRVWAAGVRRRATVVVVEALSHPWLLVRATSTREAPLLSVDLSRVNPATPVTTSAPAKPSTHSSGPTGPTGDSGASGSPAPAPPAATPPAPAPPPDPSLGPWGDPGSWHLIFDDEFNGSSLDSSVWNTGWLGSGLTGPMNTEELECYSPSQDVVSGGELDLNLLAQQQNNCPLAGGSQTVNEPYVSGMINTRDKFSYTYGYLEARVWLPGNPTSGEDWPGIWEVGNPAPQNGEIDVAEGLGGQACFHFHDPTGTGYGNCQLGMAGSWHTYGADWEPGSVRWYYDGVLVWVASTNITSAPMYLIADLALDSQWGGPIVAPATMRIDYIHVWQH